MMTVCSAIQQVSVWYRARRAGIRAWGTRSGVGLDLGSHTLKAVEVMRSGGRLTVTRIGIVETPRGAVSGGAATDPQALAPAIRALLDDAGIRSKRVVTALGGQAAVIREIAIPDMPDGDLAQAAAFEAERHLPPSAGEARCQYRVMSRTREDGQVKILLVASANDAVTRHVAPVTMAGLVSPVMEVTPLSGVRALCLGGGPDRGATVYADLGAESTDILVLDGERVRVARNIPVGGNGLTAAIAEAMSCEWNEAEALKTQRADVLANDPLSGEGTVLRLRQAIRPLVTRLATELRRSVDFYLTRVRGGAVSRVVLAGGTANLRNLPSFLGDIIGLPVQIGNPFAACDVDAGVLPDDLGEAAPALAVTVGLALRGVRA